MDALLVLYAQYVQKAYQYSRLLLYDIVDYNIKKKLYKCIFNDKNKLNYLTDFCVKLKILFHIKNGKNSRMFLNF